MLSNGVILWSHFFLKSLYLIGCWGVNPTFLSGLLQQGFHCQLWSFSHLESLHTLKLHTACNFSHIWGLIVDRIGVSGNMLASTPIATTLFLCFFLHHPTNGQVSWVQSLMSQANEQINELQLQLSASTYFGVISWNPWHMLTKTFHMYLIDLKVAYHAWQKVLRTEKPLCMKPAEQFLSINVLAWWMWTLWVVQHVFVFMNVHECECDSLGLVYARVKVTLQCFKVVKHHFT